MNVKMRFGVLSDVHIKGEGSERVFREALAYFRDRQVDAVLIAGDIADYGLTDQLVRAGDTWRSVFPGDRLPNGARVEKLFLFGNHDLNGWSYGYQKRLNLPAEMFADDKRICADFAAAWRRAFDEDFAFIRMKTVKGVPFVLNSHLQADDETEAFFAAHRAELAAQPLFFYSQHYHPAGTCSAPWTWGQDNGRITKILEGYPNAVAFSGHSHTPLADERTIRRLPSGFVSVGTSSLSYLISFGGRENTSPFGSRHAPFEQLKQMPFLVEPHMGACGGLVVTVNDDGTLELERLDFLHNQEKVGPNWIVSPKVPLDYETRAAASVPPQFAPDADVAWSLKEGTDRRKKPFHQVEVSFPVATAKTGPVRGFDYEVRVLYREADLLKVAVSKRVFSPTYWHAESAEVARATCVFAYQELPQDCEAFFEVEPLNCFGKRGAAIRSAAFRLKELAKYEKELKKSADKKEVK